MMRLLFTVFLLAALAQAQQPGPTLQVSHGGTGRTSFPQGQILIGNGTGIIQTALGVPLTALPPIPFSKLINPEAHTVIKFGEYAVVYDFHASAGAHFEGMYLREEPQNAAGATGNILTIHNSSPAIYPLTIATLPVVGQNASGVRVHGENGDIEMRLASNVEFNTGTIHYKAAGMRNLPILGTDENGNVVGKPEISTSISSLTAATKPHAVDLGTYPFDFNVAGRPSGLNGITVKQTSLATSFGPIFHIWKFPGSSSVPFQVTAQETPYYAGAAIGNSGDFFAMNTGFKGLGQLQNFGDVAYGNPGSEIYVDDGGSLFDNVPAVGPATGPPPPLTGDYNWLTGLTIDTRVRRDAPIAGYGSTATALDVKVSADCVRVRDPRNTEQVQCSGDPAVTSKTNSVIGAAIVANGNDFPAQVCNQGSCRSSTVGMSSDVWRAIGYLHPSDFYSSKIAARITNMYSDGTRMWGGTGIEWHSLALLVNAGKSWFNGDIVLQPEIDGALSTATLLGSMNKAICDNHTPGSLWVMQTRSVGLPAGAYRMIANGGSGWAVGNTFTIAGPSTMTRQATGRVTEVQAGVVVNIQLTDEGLGYADNAAAATTATSGSGTGLVLDIRAQTNRGRFHYENNPVSRGDVVEICESTVGGYQWVNLPARLTDLVDFSGQTPTTGQVPIWSEAEKKWVPGVIGTGGGGGGGTRTWMFAYDLVGQGGESNGPINYLSGAASAPVMSDCNGNQATPCELYLPGGGTAKFWYIKARVPKGAVGGWTLALTYRSDGDASAVVRPTYRCVPMGTVPNITSLPTASSTNDAVGPAGTVLPAATPAGAIREQEVPLSAISCADNADLYIGFTWPTVTGNLYFSHFSLSTRANP
jgi:hypothetical protein